MIVILVMKELKHRSNHVHVVVSYSILIGESKKLFLRQSEVMKKSY